MTVLVELDYAIGPETRPGTYEIDDTLVSTHIVPRSSGLVAYFNQASFCGFTDWSKDIAKEVTGLASCQIPQAGERFYSLIAIEDGALYVGKTTETLDARTPERRPVELDRSNPGLRVP